MADKTGMTDLLPVLERLCSDYRAMEYLLDHHHPDGIHWIRLLADSRKAVQSRVVGIFDGIRGDLQSGQADASSFEALINALNEITLLKPL